jgi:hypothetical protein
MILFHMACNKIKLERKISPNFWEVKLLKYSLKKKDLQQTLKIYSSLKTSWKLPNCSWNNLKNILKISETSSWIPPTNFSNCITFKSSSKRVDKNPKALWRLFLKSWSIFQKLLTKKLRSVFFFFFFVSPIFLFWKHLEIWIPKIYR